MLRERQVARYWDENAAGWSQGLERGDDVLRRAFHEPAFRRFLGPLKGQRVLDAGCGDGDFTRKLADAGARVVGVDLSAKMLEVALASEAARPRGIRYVRGSYTRLEAIAPRSIDTVCAFMSLMDGPDLERAFRAFGRVLKRRGALVFAVLHPCFAMTSFGWWTGAADAVPRLQVAQYFTRGSRVSRWRFPAAAKTDRPFAIPRFPRTLSDHVDALSAAGFQLEALAEPRPGAAACRRHPALLLWREQAAAFLHVRARFR